MPPYRILAAKSGLQKAVAGPITPHSESLEKSLQIPCHTRGKEPRGDTFGGNLQKGQVFS
jgi:hypothetical protein